MTEQRMRELRELGRMMTTIPGFEEKGPPVPRCCAECEYYHPQWKYRSCYHIHCPYGVKEQTFRNQPLEQDSFPVKEVVVMNGV